MFTALVLLILIVAAVFWLAKNQPQWAEDVFVPAEELAKEGLNKLEADVAKPAPAPASGAATPTAPPKV